MTPFAFFEKDRIQYHWDTEFIISQKQQHYTGPHLYTNEGTQAADPEIVVQERDGSVARRWLGISPSDNDDLKDI